MNIYSNKYINFISIIITIIIFLVVFFAVEKVREEKRNTTISKEVVVQEDKKDESSIQSNISNEWQGEKKIDNNWYIEINSINLKAPINESTNMEILNNYIGHFEDTALTTGNIGLAAHNRGFAKNYFENLKNLKMEDEIKYVYNDFQKLYIVDTIEIIRNTDWSYLENTEENKITMITCTENEPEYRLCVQATEKGI